METSPYIIDFCPHFINDYLNNNNFNVIDRSMPDILRHAISYTFFSLSKQIELNIYKQPLTNKCDLIRNKLGEVLEQLNLDIRYIETQDILGNDVIGHSILTLKDDDKVYLIDPSYSQFFLKEKCSSENYLIYNNTVIKAPDPGYYYLLNRDKQPIAKKILEEGFILLTEDVAKAYADSFYKTRRGKGAYFDMLNTPTDISGAIYLKAFLKTNIENKNII